MACEAKPDRCHEGLAAFIVDLFEKFEKQRGSETATKFVWHLREAVLRAFHKCWDVVRVSSSVIFTVPHKHTFPQNSPTAITYTQCPTQAYVASAQSLSSFIGELYSYNVVLISQITDCLAALIGGLNSFEHVTAIHNMIQYSESRLWCPLPHKPDANLSQVFISTYLQKANTLAVNSSVLGKSVTVEERGKMIWSVVDAVNRMCAKDAGQPGPRQSLIYTAVPPLLPPGLPIRRMLAPAPWPPRQS
jgi:hypothetical protein